MHNDDLGEEMARRAADRNGNAPLTRDADPDKVAHHLAVAENSGVVRITREEREKLALDFRAAAKPEGSKPIIRDYLKSISMDDLLMLTETTDIATFRLAQAWIAAYVPPDMDSLVEPKRRDDFATESPIRAFTDFQVSGTVAIGKGFRPALRHLAAYLDAMEKKEGWTFLQIILPADDATDPTIVFRRDRILVNYIPDRETVDDALAAAAVAAVETDIREVLRPGGRPTFVPNVGADPINPAYYGGQACAEIIEYMPTNVGLAGKYCWRLGEKDAEDQECGKAAWYLKREIVLHTQGVAPRPVFGASSGENGRWYVTMAKDRIDARDMPRWRKHVMFDLVAYAVTGHLTYLDDAIAAFEGTRRVPDADLPEGVKP